MNRRLGIAVNKLDKSIQKTFEPLSGRLGIPLNGQLTVEIPSRNGYVYVRLRNNQNEVIQAFNEQVSPVYDLPVMVKWEGNRYTVIGRDTMRYNDWGSYSSFLPRHGNSHSFNPEGGGGGDIVWVYTRQFLPLLAMPSGSLGAGDVYINPYTFLKDDGTWRQDGNTGTINLLTYSPTGSNAVIVLLYDDTVSGNYGIIVGSGSYFNNAITGAAQILPYVPSLTNPDWMPIAAVRLVSGTAFIGWDNIYDLRQFLMHEATGTGGGGGLGSVAVQDSGVPQGNATVFNFDGPNVLATVSGTVAYVYVTGSGGGGAGTGSATFTIEDVSVQITGSSAAHFVVTGTIAVGTEEVFYNGVLQKRPTHYSVDANGKGFQTVFTGTPGDTLIIAYGNIGSSVPSINTYVNNYGIFAEDDGVPKGTGTIVNFRGANVVATVSGTTVDVFVTGSLGGGAPYSVLGTADPSTPSGIVISTLLASPDKIGQWGNAVYEFNDTGTVFSWHPIVPGRLDSHRTFMSHLYINYTGSVGDFGTVALTITGGFDARMKISSMGVNATGTSLINGAGVGLYLADSAEANSMYLMISEDSTNNRRNEGIQITGSNTPGNYTLTQFSFPLQTTGPYYVRILKGTYPGLPGNVIDRFRYYVSTDGMLWRELGEFAKPLAVGKIGIFLQGNANGGNYEVAIDWIRIQHNG